MSALRSCLLLVAVAGIPFFSFTDSSSRFDSAPLTTGDDLQAALDAARPGDTLLLAPGAEFVGNFTLPRRPDDSDRFITVKTAGSDLPGPGERTGPEMAGKLAVIRSETAMAALATSPAAHHWRIENVEFGPTRGGANEVIALGSGERDQRSAAVVPHDLVLDRVYVHGDPRTGQKRGVALNSASTQILNSYFSDIKALGIDGQAIAGWNGPGPFLIENNYIEASGENLMFGGADPWIEQLVPSDITIRWNLFSRPVSWREPILPPPAEVRAGPCGAACTPGTGPAPGDYAYSIVAEGGVSGATAVSAASPPVKASATGGALAVEWTPVRGARSYKVFRLSPQGNRAWRVTDTRFVDAGSGGSEEAPPKRGSLWSVKNLLELKNARRVTIEGNRFEHHWPQAQAGYAIVFTPRNQNGRAPWSVVRDVRFAGNVVRRVSGGINISGADDEKPSARTQGITIENNLFVDVGGSWGAPGDFVQIVDGPSDVRIERNTSLQTGRALAVDGGRHGEEVSGFVFRENLVRHNRYGLFGADVGTGRPAIARYFPGAIVEGNTFAGGSAKDYPQGNRFLASDALDGAVAEDDAAYRLRDRGVAAEAGADLDALRGAGVRPRTTAPGSAETRRQRRD